VLLSFFHLGTKWLVEGGKKDAAYIASLFDPWVQKLDPRNSCLDCGFFYGASNVQLAGQLLPAKYPLSTFRPAPPIWYHFSFQMFVRSFGNFD
jgi:hypothetical protein